MSKQQGSLRFGLNWSLSWAYENDYDFLWLFDQDSSPHQDCLAKLLDTYTKCFRKGDKVSIVSCTPVDVRTGHVTAPALFLRDQFVGMKVSDHIEPYECDAPITSGSLLNVNLVAHIPPSDPKLFIDGIDLEYGLRLKKQDSKTSWFPMRLWIIILESLSKLIFLAKQSFSKLFGLAILLYLPQLHLS
ncbi:MAG: hypothetical protein HC878_16525 [Leptolyngbyaceae cyanobacterium SL_5_14]|nr:hypothetical protein [Leptolyngbyaceae cyanobacterium SL_5_14]